MPRPYSNYVVDAVWDDPKKIASRKEAIILTYNEFFKRSSIQPNKQYWTMCGAYFDSKGTQLHGELGQLIESNLITPDQFHGVDREKSIIQKNQKLFPNIKWFHGDFKEIMGEFSIQNKFNPAIINYDGVMQPKFGSQYLKSILKFIDNNVHDQLLLITNFVLRSPYRKQIQFNPIDVINQLLKIYWFPDHWYIKPQAYTYEGSGKRSQSEMGMIIFVKNKHDQIQYTKNKRLI